MNEELKKLYRLYFNGFNLKSEMVNKYCRVSVYISKNHPSIEHSGFCEGWNTVTKLETLTTEGRAEQTKCEERYEAIKTIYRIILVYGWYVTIFYDNFHPNHMCFLLRDPDCIRREIVRLPL